MKSAASFYTEHLYDMNEIIKSQYPVVDNTVVKLAVLEKITFILVALSLYSYETQGSKALMDERV